MICISYGTSAMAMPYTIIVGGPTDYICLLVSSSYIVGTYNLSNLRVLRGNLTAYSLGYTASRGREAGGLCPV